MARHIQGEHLHDIITRDLCIRKLSQPRPEKELFLNIDVPHLVPSNLEIRLYELVSDVNGLVVIAAFEYNTNTTLIHSRSTKESLAWRLLSARNRISLGFAGTCVNMGVGSRSIYRVFDVVPAIYGYATAYSFTKDASFLGASVRLSEYFYRRGNEASGNKDSESTVYWDFDAPRPPTLLDSSAAMIACAGILLLHRIAGKEHFLLTVM
ncbi:Fc.00g034930.m01.CDS01 [Cosmosporella sp. VM-42]